jgi:putative oxidoreductase
MPRALTATTQTWATLPLRLTLGAIMFAHGAQKIFGAWGGKGFSAWIGGTAPLNLRPSWAWLAAAAFSELLGGTMVLLGLFTRAGALVIACVMSVAIAGVHWPNGFFINSGGFEYPFALLGMALALMMMGGGNASLDSQLNIGR